MSRPRLCPAFFLLAKKLLHFTCKIDFVHVRHEEYGTFAAVAMPSGQAADGGLRHCRRTYPFTAKSYTLSLAKQVLAGDMEQVIKTVEHNIRLV